MRTSRAPKRRSKFELLIVDGQLRAKLELPFVWTLSGAIAAIIAVALKIWIRV